MLFSKIRGDWTAERAWWWGVTYGDGCVYSNVSTGDYRVHVVGSESTVRRWLGVLDIDKAPQKIKRANAYQGYVDSKELVSWLGAQGLRPRKTHDLCWPSDLPAEAVKPFLRGLWDTDGSLCIERRRARKNKGNDSPRASYTSACLAFVQEVRAQLESVVGVARVAISTETKIAKKSGKLSTWYTLKYGGTSAMQVADYLYASPVAHLVNEDRRDAYAELCALRERLQSRRCACGKPVELEDDCRSCWWVSKDRITGDGVGCACGSEKPVIAKGLCHACYSRKRRVSSKARDTGWSRSELTRLEDLGRLPCLWRDMPSEEKESRVQAVYDLFRGRGVPKGKEPVVASSVVDQVRNGRLVVDAEKRTVAASGGIGQVFCSWYHPQRMQAAHRGQLSVEAAFADEAALKKAIAYQLRVGDPVTPTRVLRAVCALHKAPTNFPPVLARWVVDNYAPVSGTVLDPCAGYGGRLLGTLASGNSLRYVGFDIEERTVVANQRMVDAVGYPNAVVSVADVLDDSDWPAADLLFTGPPYYDCETYGADSSDSLVGVAYETWVDSFFGALFRKSAFVPRLVLNVSSFRSGGRVRLLPEDVVSVAKRCGFGLRDQWTWKQGTFTRRSFAEQLLVFEPAW